MNKNTSFYKSLKYSIYDGSAHAVMVGAGESYLMAYVVALGFSNFAIGLTASIPLLIAACSQLYIVNRAGDITSRRFFIVRLALLQGAMWIPLMVLPALLPAYRVSVVVLLLILYHSCIHLATPVWNSWMADLVDPAKRGDYFGTRNKYRALSEVIAYLICGFILQFMSTDDSLDGFYIIFCVAFAARGVSALFLHKIEEPTYQRPQAEDQFTFLEFLKKAPHNNFGRFVLFNFCLIAGSFLASPFFTAYMLKTLHFSYIELVAIYATCLVFQFFFYHSWGIIADRYGNIRVLKVTALGLSVIPVLWVLTRNFWCIIFFQFLAGVTWSGYLLTSSNFIYDAVSQKRLQRCVAYFNFMGNFAIFIGALCGGAITRIYDFFLGDLCHMMPQGFVYYLLFTLSSVLRLLAVVFFAERLKDVRPVQQGSLFKLLGDFMTVSLTFESGGRRRPQQQDDLKK
ncbi:MAG: MFS transporter [Deltaproteobacteria bacterium]|nr:MFS transporter [Deltaproteobacteria bacterium]